MAENKKKNAKVSGKGRQPEKKSQKEQAAGPVIKSDHMDNAEENETDDILSSDLSTENDKSANNGENDLKKILKELTTEGKAKGVLTYHEIEDAFEHRYQSGAD